MRFESFKKCLGHFYFLRYNSVVSGGGGGGQVLFVIIIIIIGQVLPSESK